MANGTFATVINCMDGRVQRNVNDFIREKFGVEYVDTITLAGPCEIIAEQDHKRLINDIKFRMDISVNKHLSKVAVIVGHADCAAVDASIEKHKQLISTSVEVIKNWGFDIRVIGLWVDENWIVQELKKDKTGDTIVSGTRS